MSATVTLPAGIPAQQIHLEGYTGQQGDKGQDYRATVDKDGKAQFATTRPLGANEGLTIVVAFPKGYVTPPTTAMEIDYFLHDNASVLVGLIGLVVVLGYFLVVWAIAGRDLPAGTIIPLYLPPAGLSPAVLRYVRKMGYDDKVFAAALIDLAVQGYINITEQKVGVFGGSNLYTLQKKQEPPPETTPPGTSVTTSPNSTVATATRAKIAPEEAAALNALLPLPGSSIVLTNANYQQMQGAIAGVKSTLKSHFQAPFFVTNTTYFVPGVVLSVLTIVLAWFVQISKEDPGRMIGGAMFTLMPLIFFIVIGIPLWRKVFSGGGVSRVAAIIQAIFITGFLSIFIAVGIFLTGGFPVGLFLTVLGLILLNELFYQLMKAPTRSGRKLLDQIEGFRMYLDTAEKDELNLQHPPEKTPQLFEQYLPYALALDVSQRWCERFAGVLASAEQDGHPYHPGWYDGDSWRTLGAAGFASSLADSMSSAIVSSSTPPGSSSGSGGGGSSGGGGGGGGGGGW